MSYEARISRLPQHQRSAATSLRATPSDPRALSDALHAGVPMVIITFLAQRTPSVVREIVRDADTLAAA